MEKQQRRFDVHIPFQRLRHSALARLARQGIYYAAIGREGYPFVFSEVAEGEAPPQGVSPNLYVHIPFCRSLCTHCPYNKMVYREASYRPYSVAVADEMTRYLARVITRTSVWSFTKAQSSAYTTVTRESYVGFGAGAGSKVDGEFWFNTFSVPEYNKLTQTRPAIRLQTSDQLRRLHWLYWQVYNTRIDPQQYAAHFHRDLLADFALVMGLMRLLGWTHRSGSVYTFSERGARWAHRFQMLFSLTFIDEVWTQCQREPWPKRIMLY